MAASALDIHLAGACIPGVLRGTPLFEEWEDRGWLLSDAGRGDLGLSRYAGLADARSGCWT